MHDLLKQLTLGCSHVAGASGEAWKQGNVDFTGLDMCSSLLYLWLTCCCFLELWLCQRLPDSCCARYTWSATSMLIGVRACIILPCCLGYAASIPWQEACKCERGGRPWKH